MKSSTVWAIIGVLILAAIVWKIYSNVKINNAMSNANNPSNARRGCINDGECVGLLGAGAKCQPSGGCSLPNSVARTITTVVTPSGNGNPSGQNSGYIK